MSFSIKTQKMNIEQKIGVICIALVMLAAGCNQDSDKKVGKEAAFFPKSDNEEVARYMESFKGVGALTDTSQPTLPQKTLSHFKYPNDLALDLVLAEPQIVQPVELSFDHRGRLWVVQYHQYPYPEGLKVTSIDNYLRVKFDKIPTAPPGGAKGADKITIFEDTNGDGKYDKATDAIKGLNIATSVITGRGKIWVLNPPYLLAYPDTNNDGIPEGNPVVHLQGFGLEDTHAVANSLRWGPDGWLYGAQGSTATADISSSVSKHVAFQGQAIWRYNTDSHVFEVYAEGGGNTFNVEFDSKGRLYSGDNGYDRGPNFKQGAYYQKSLGKHGPYTNAYTFGNLKNMQLSGERKRFTHSLIKYDENVLPQRYKGKMFALNPLLNFVQLTRLESFGSTFKTIDEDKILTTDDHWFRPVNVKAGPDGAVYIADWYDSRLSHVDPRDTWHKTSGRVYRLCNKTNKIILPKFDISKYSVQQLIQLLKNENKWYRQQAQIQFANRKNKSFVPLLLPLLKSADGQLALEALWAINLSGGLNDDIAHMALSHKDPFVRNWAVRLAGDHKLRSPVFSKHLIRLAETEADPETRSQIAATAKRLPGRIAIPVIECLLKSGDDATDADIPLLIWWAIEAKAEADRDKVLGMFQQAAVWKSKTIQNTVLKRLIQRYVMAGGEANFIAAARLIELAPSKNTAKELISGLSEGLRGRDLIGLSPALAKAIKPYQNELFGGPLALGIKQGKGGAIDKAILVIADPKADSQQRLAYSRLLGESGQKKAVPALLKIVQTSGSSAALKQTALQALQYFDMPEIGRKVVAAYPQYRGDEGVRTAAIGLVSSRSLWAASFLDAIEKTRNINKTDVSDAVARKLKLLKDPGITERVSRLWPNVKLATSAEKNESIARFAKIIRSGKGNLQKGRVLYLSNCGPCHRLFDGGGNVGPDLTGYDRDNMNSMLLNIVDPNADIREGYVIHKIVTTDGRTLEGKIISRNGDAITLQPVAGKNMVLSATKVKEMKAQQVSLMPERILEHLSEQEVRDIFSYIMKK
ncbi:putative membrane-bound dehydrogenase domain-containing protein [Pedobacter africanus]|uniref:Putative membrane-bound dehydrogenase domain-containing protein n=2 Tax=Pedobacter africanus TaxID=151894 RepID=A0A1W2DC55_9SPHI|nr:putative membrane-bound dehydrogenase domain-containing protein [Pedobacter africanus]